MKKIALMTWHHVNNYGTAFQAYALSTVLKKLGCDVDMVNYHRITSSPLKKRLLHEQFLSFTHRISAKLRNKIFFNFKKETFGFYFDKYFQYTKPCHTNQDFYRLNNEYDGFVCGSDQIWGPEWFDGRFFLDFVENPNALIAYAPSIGVSNIKDNAVKDLMAPLIGRFPKVSVREQSGCEIVKNITSHTDVVNVLDPVFLLNMEEWQCIKEDIALPSENYMLIFFLANNIESFRIAMNQADLKGLTPLVMHCTQSEDNEYANIPDCTPGQLISLIENASYICTDSFHISVLSIIFNKQFKVFNKVAQKEANSKNSRLHDLFIRLNITDAEYMVDNSFDNAICFEILNSKLMQLKEYSFEYLKSCVNNLPAKRLMVDEKGLDCWKSKAKCSCPGEYSEQFVEYREMHANSCLVKSMSTFSFSLNPKCYRCAKYRMRRDMDNRMPLFYSELNTAFGKGKSPISIYFKYYFSYHLKYLFEKS
ncbi:polysaccharide pyruvyl transferase family protein [Bacteroides stercorirosoris]|uniref:polysaccharide pyruvyl transferase family protein n=1 Tax=Bacteroides stercorirosoris TaxID=871324 RepID=UPI00351263E8